MDLGRPGRTGGRGPSCPRRQGLPGAAHAKTPVQGKNKPEIPETGQQGAAKLRAPGEGAKAQLKSWRILCNLRCCPWRAGQLAKAIHVLQLREA